jgi:hypothetical protein
LRKLRHFGRRRFSKLAPRISSKGARDVRGPSGPTGLRYLNRRRLVVSRRSRRMRTIPRAMGYGLLRGPLEAVPLVASTGGCRRDCAPLHLNGAGASLHQDLRDLGRRVDWGLVSGSRHPAIAPRPASGRRLIRRPLEVERDKDDLSSVCQNEKRECAELSTERACTPVDVGHCGAIPTERRHPRRRMTQYPLTPAITGCPPSRA